MKNNLLSVRTMGFGNGIQYECNHVCVYAENIDGHKNKMEKKKEKLVLLFFTYLLDSGISFFQWTNNWDEKWKGHSMLSKWMWTVMRTQYWRHKGDRHDYAQ